MGSCCGRWMCRRRTVRWWPTWTGTGSARSCSDAPTERYGSIDERAALWRIRISKGIRVMSWHDVLLFACGLSAFSASPGVSQTGPKPWKLDRILITFWSPPPTTEEALAAVATEGYNLTWTPETGLDVARKHGLKAMLQDNLLTPST